MRESVSRGALTVFTEPWVAYWRGSPISLTAAQCRLLDLLLRFPEVSTSALIFRVGSQTGMETIRTQFSKMRKVFRQEGVPVRIENPKRGRYAVKVCADDLGAKG